MLSFFQRVTTTYNPAYSYQTGRISDRSGHGNIPDKQRAQPVDFGLLILLG